MVGSLRRRFRSHGGGVYAGGICSGSATNYNDTHKKIHTLYALICHGVIVCIAVAFPIYPACLLLHIIPLLYALLVIRSGYLLPTYPVQQ